jgi:hypothetical protein
VELQAGDRQILEALQAAFPVHSHLSERTRDTNFKDGYASCVWTLYDRETREELERLGVPVGAKSETVAPPTWDFSPRDYFRGLVDGDGSLGLTAKGWPFVSLTTKSEAIALAYVGYLEGVIGQRKRANRNRRDHIYNLTVFKEDAQKLSRELYEGSALRLERKHAAYVGLMRWVRPEGMERRGPKNWWTPEQDSYIRTHPVQDAMLHLGRSERSIRMRKYHLTKT